MAHSGNFGMVDMYDANYFDNLREGSSASAKRILPLVRAVVRYKSAVDVGCGPGEWLAASGAADFLGIDGYAEPSTPHFLSHDLAKPLVLSRRFDLAMSLEVAEHLPEPASDTLVETLCSLSDAILFSAAIPGQGGRGHINEQWPDYWQQKFAARSFRMIDCLRERIWNDETIAPWYRQNLFLVLRFPEKYPELAPYLSRPILRLVHPAFCTPPTIRQSARFLQAALKRRLLS